MSTPESGTSPVKVFKKCQQCDTKPASIICKECEGSGLFCYGCSRDVHNGVEHAYEYACYNGKKRFEADMLTLAPAEDSKLEKIPEVPEGEWGEDRYSGLDVSEISKEVSKGPIETETAMKVVEMVGKTDRQPEKPSLRNEPEFKVTPRYGKPTENEDMVKFSDCAEDKELKKGLKLMSDAEMERSELRKFTSRQQDEQKENLSTNITRNVIQEWPDMNKILEVKDYGYSKPSIHEAANRYAEPLREPAYMPVREEPKVRAPRIRDNVDESVNMRGLSKDLASEVFPSLGQPTRPGSHMRRIESHPSPTSQSQNWPQPYEHKSQSRPNNNPSGYQYPISNHAPPQASANYPPYSTHTPNPYQSSYPQNPHQTPYQPRYPPPQPQNPHSHQASQQAPHPHTQTHQPPHPTQHPSSQAQETFSRAYIESLKDMHR